ncbi:hypothetical protein [Orenia metallireducens]|nr:hypothetical protein [Orenia metallireducens]
MKTEEAYSLDYGDVVDAEKAHELYWDGTIKNKKNFECPDPNCSLQITCANIDKSRDEMKKSPHFRIYDEHSSKCDIGKNTEEKEEQKNSNKNRTENKYIDSKFDILLFQRPKSHSQKLITKSNGEIDHKKQKLKLKQEKNKNEKRNSEYFTIKPLISKFEKYKEDNVLNDYFIKIRNYPINYADMFVKISEKELNLYSNYKRIYYGTGNVERKGNNFAIEFTNSIISEGSYYSTTIYITEKLIKKHYMNRKWKRKLEELANLESDEIIFFVYSKPIVKSDYPYINFPITSLNFLDYRFK